MAVADDRRVLTDRILTLLAQGGGAAYFGEPVTQLEHALQTAALAEQAGASGSLVIAALLHDIGHLLHGLGEDLADRRIDGRHEAIGERWLASHFSAAVTEPVRLHVAAKRYLCAVDPAYAAALSPASQESLALQGGPMTATETNLFERNPWANAATALRRWDDQAKTPGLDVPGLSHYRARLEEALQPR